MENPISTTTLPNDDNKSLTPDIASTASTSVVPKDASDNLPSQETRRVEVESSNHDDKKKKEDDHPTGLSSVMNHISSSTMNPTTSNSRKHKKKNASTGQLPLLSTIQMKQVDAAFEALFGYRWGEKPTLMIVNNQRQFQLLQSIFGTRSAEKVLYNPTQQQQEQKLPLKRTKSIDPKTLPDTSAITHPTKKTKTITTAETTLPLPERVDINSISQGSEKQENPTKSLEPAAALRPENVEDSSSSSFPSHYNTDNNNAPPRGGGVDALLEQMNQKGGPSTLMKTALDWESFKQDSGTLGDKLEQHAESKGAYLLKQDFLLRVDQREFQQEKIQRDKQRSSNNKN